MARRKSQYCAPFKGVEENELKVQSTISDSDDGQVSHHHHLYDQSQNRDLLLQLSGPIRKRNGKDRNFNVYSVELTSNTLKCNATTEDVGRHFYKNFSQSTTWDQRRYITQLVKGYAVFLYFVVDRKT